MGFISRDWLKEIGCEESGEAVPKEDHRLQGPIPIPVSINGGKTLDWSRSVESESLAFSPTYLGPITYRG